MGQRACKRRGSVCKRWKHPAQAPGWRLASLSCSSLARSRSGTSTPIQTRCIHERQESSPVCQVLDKVRLHEIRPKTFCVVSVENSERPPDPNRLEWKTSHGGRPKSTFCKIAHEDDMISCELSDRDARIDSNPDRVHARPAFSSVNL